MSQIKIDIETIPSTNPEVIKGLEQGLKDNFKPPSTLTKAQAAADLGYGVADAKDIKFISKDEMIAKWVAEFKDSKIEEIAEQEWRKTSFDGGQGEVVTICFKHSGKVYSFARDYKEEGSEVKLLTDFCASINELLSRKDGRLDSPFFIGHNVTFDLKFLFRRLVILGINPEFSLPFNGRHGQHYYCTMQAWAGFGERISQDNLCKALGLPLKPDGIDGSKVWDNIKAGNVANVLEYNKYDVETVELIHKKLTFSKD